MTERREVCAKLAHYATKREAEIVREARRAEAAAKGESVRHWRKRFCTLHGLWIVTWEKNRDGNVAAQRKRRRERGRLAKAAGDA